MRLQVIWVEIPVKDLERATAFYKTVFELEPSPIIDEGVRRHVTLADMVDGNPGISINQTANFEPGDKGVLVYLHVGEDSAPLLARVAAAGGKIAENKTSMGATGYYATILDTEGNILCLYSNH
jgi:predicted enzyme related to lactoylglutathione lyase